ncbi:unnamed protein product [Lepeophtheirus salmonis]|uniref:(salmon louse) hypothetical protein n=1 Tax=Lepeophtheirus salmonis TaxID=72036 RepID=A0A7R8HAL8_LEPSM|nr:unnamed protein product [Lepeophtheirus salmonis]CAF2968826.1 unnamed protein product [Lepeophtheirus salmonis]
MSSSTSNLNGSLSKEDEEEEDNANNNNKSAPNTRPLMQKTQLGKSPPPLFHLEPEFLKRPQASSELNLWKSNKQKKALNKTLSASDLTGGSSPSLISLPELTTKTNLDVVSESEQLSSETLGSTVVVVPPNKEEVKGSSSFSSSEKCFPLPEAKKVEIDKSCGGLPSRESKESITSSICHDGSSFSVISRKSSSCNGSSKSETNSKERNGSLDKVPSLTTTKSMDEEGDTILLNREKEIDEDEIKEDDESNRESGRDSSATESASVEDQSSDEDNNDTKSKRSPDEIRVRRITKKNDSGLDVIEIEETIECLQHNPKVKYSSKQHLLKKGTTIGTICIRNEKNEKCIFVFEGSCNHFFWKERISNKKVKITTNLENYVHLY